MLVSVRFSTLTKVAKEVVKDSASLGLLITVVIAMHRFGYLAHDVIIRALLC